jgi:hypothetical protein
MVRAMTRTSSGLRALVVPCLSVSLLALASGCGGSSTAPKVANAKPGDMPVGGEWTGVYYSQLQGYLHIMNEGNSAQGRWRITAGEKFGELAGEITGDILRYEWTERTIGMVGPTASRTGRGYFRYTIPKEGEAHEIAGERGTGQDETGDPWKAVKQMNQVPDFKKVTPDEFEDRPMSGSGDWDDSGEKKEGEGDSEGGDAPKSDDEGSGGP